MKSKPRTKRRSASPHRIVTTAASTRPSYDATGRDDLIAELRCALEGNDGQMLAPAAMVDAQFDLDAGPSTNECLRSSTRRSPRPPRPRFESRLPARGHRPGVRLFGRDPTEKRMRPFGVEPDAVPVEFSPERVALEGDQDRPRALALQRPDEPLDDREAAEFPDRAEPLLDASTATPPRVRNESYR